MKPFFLAAITIFLFSCNEAGDKNDPNQAMDDTARMRDQPTPPSILFDRVFLMDKDIPSVIKVKGKVIEASRWTDSLGENYVILSSTGPFDDKGEDEDGQTVELYAAHYIQKGNDYPKKWEMKDGEKACPFDITAGFIPGALTITDIDKDNIAEIKIQYSIACRSDVSPATMKLVMVENGIKHSLRGNHWLKYSPDFKYTVTEKDVNLESLPPLKDETEAMLRTFGRYETEKEFATAPTGFIEYARKEWLKHVMERMGE